jgi:hypothetical protein
MGKKTSAAKSAAKPKAKGKSKQKSLSFTAPVEGGE